MTLPMLMRALSDNNLARGELSSIILQDPAITDQMLQVANSPFFRPNDQSIESVDQAIFMLGIEGIRSVVAAAVMRPMLAARTSAEAQFAQRVWLWGMTCARSAELIARTQGQDPNAHFMVGLLPALAYLSLFREVQRIHRQGRNGVPLEPSQLQEALRRHGWTVAQRLAKSWNLPPHYLACLQAAEQSTPGQPQTPLNDGITLGTREVLRQARQRNLAEDELMAALSLPEDQFHEIRQAVVAMLKGAQHP